MVPLNRPDLVLVLISMISDKRGVSHEVQEEYWQRFEHAFATEADEFINSIINDTPVPLPLSTGIKVMEIARGLQSALWSGEVSRWDEEGRLVTEDVKEAKGGSNSTKKGFVKGQVNGDTNEADNTYNNDVTSQQ